MGLCRFYLTGTYIPMGYTQPPKLLASDYIRPATSAPVTPQFVPPSLTPAFGDTKLADPLSEAELLRKEVLGMTEDEKQLYVKAVRQKLLDFAAQRTTDVVDKEEIRKAIAIACSTYVPIIPSDPELASKTASPKAGTTSKKPAKAKATITSADIFKNLFAGLPVAPSAPANTAAPTTPTAPTDNPIV